MERNTWTMLHSLARQTRPVTARGYDERWAHLGLATASQRHSAVRYVRGVSLKQGQTISVVWCADVAASLSVTRRCDLLGFGATTAAEDVAHALRDRPRVRRDRDRVELCQSSSQEVSQ